MSTKKKEKIADCMSTEEKVKCINDLVGNEKINVLGKRRVDTDDGTVFWVVDFEDKGKTQSIECDDPIDQMVAWINSKWPNHQKILREIGVEKLDVGMVSKWERQVAKDGTSQMELICTEVDGYSFTECFRNEIIAATEGLHNKTCSLGLRKKERAEKICVGNEVLI